VTVVVSSPRTHAISSPQELWSLLNFLDKDAFADEDHFVRTHSRLESHEQVDHLQSIIRPRMLRRLKEDVERSIAPKEETIIEVELTPIQKQYYRALLERNFGFLSRGGSKTTPRLMNTMMELRKCCNHPFLIKGAEETILAEAAAQRMDAVTATVRGSGKLVLLDKLLPRLRQGGHRVLIFSQMVRVLDILEDYCRWKGYGFERLDGRVRGDLRQNAIDRFCRPDSSSFIFLLCTRAGGVGINLTAADTVIIFDSDWNPQNDLQAQARAHRIGQEKTVKIYRLLTRNTYEKVMFERASMKLGLDRAILQNVNRGPVGSGNAPGPLGSMSKEDVEKLLRQGAYGSLLSGDADESERFFEEDIDTILSRRAQTVRVEGDSAPARNEDGTRQLSSTLARATFTTGGANEMDIDVNDPDFWTKLARRAEINVKYDETSELIIDEPRARRRTQRFNGATGGADGMLDGMMLEDDDDLAGLGGGRGSSGSDVGSGTEADEEPAAPGAVGQEWRRFEVMRLERLLMRWGWGRWTLILDGFGASPPATQADLCIVCAAILREAFALATQAGEDKSWRCLIHSLQEETMMYAQPYAGERALLAAASLHGDQGYMRHMGLHWRRILTRVHMLWELSTTLLPKWLQRQLVAGGPPGDIDVPLLKGIPTPWWCRQADIALLCGAFKHGYDRWDLVKSDNVVLSALADELGGAAALAALEWPNDVSLGLRVRRVVTASRKAAERADRRGYTAMTTWGREEQHDLFRTLCYFGLPGPLDESSNGRVIDTTMALALSSLRVAQATSGSTAAGDTVAPSVAGVDGDGQAGAGGTVSNPSRVPNALAAAARSLASGQSLDWAAFRAASTSLFVKRRDEDLDIAAHRLLRYAAHLLVFGASSSEDGKTKPSTTASESADVQAVESADTAGAAAGGVAGSTDSKEEGTSEDSIMAEALSLGLDFESAQFLTHRIVLWAELRYLVAPLLQVRIPVSSMSRISTRTPSSSSSSSFPSSSHNHSITCGYSCFSCRCLLFAIFMKLSQCARRTWIRCLRGGQAHVILHFSKAPVSLGASVSTVHCWLPTRLCMRPSTRGRLPILKSCKVEAWI
jgi:hypothetical protein